jgi:hypothetical protein
VFLGLALFILTFSPIPPPPPPPPPQKKKKVYLDILCDVVLISLLSYKSFITTKNLEMFEMKVETKAASDNAGGR